MAKTLDKTRTKVRAKTERPPLYKVILLNDDYTPREFVVQVLKAVFRMNEDQAYRVMMTAHRRGVCVVAHRRGARGAQRGRAHGPRHIAQHAVRSRS